MKKYWLVIKNTWNETLSFRLNFTMWRVRIVISTLTFYFFWLAVMPQNEKLFGYTQSLMLTYILGSTFFGSIILTAKSVAIGDDINQGNLSNLLIRPINYFLYWIARDIGDKAMNIVFSITELVILFFLLHPPIFIQTNITYIVLTLISILLAMLLFFFSNFLIGFIGFWSPEIWAPRFIYFIILDFFAGQLFPLDIMPKAIYSIFQYLPFQYLLFFPLKVYLGQLPLIEVYKGMLISFIWVLILYEFVNIIWVKGLKNYTAQGR